MEKHSIASVFSTRSQITSKLSEFQIDKDFKKDFNLLLENQEIKDHFITRLIYQNLDINMENMTLIIYCNELKKILLSNYDSQTILEYLNDKFQENSNSKSPNSIADKFYLICLGLLFNFEISGKNWFFNKLINDVTIELAEDQYSQIIKNSNSEFTLNKFLLGKIVTDDEIKDKKIIIKFQFYLENYFFYNFLNLDEDFILIPPGTKYIVTNTTPIIFEQLRFDEFVHKIYDLNTQNKKIYTKPNENFPQINLYYNIKLLFQTPDSDIVTKANCLNNISHAYFIQNNIEESKKYLSISFSLYQELISNLKDDNDLVIYFYLNFLCLFADFNDFGMGQLDILEESIIKYENKLAKLNLLDYFKNHLFFQFTSKTIKKEYSFEILNEKLESNNLLIEKNIKYKKIMKIISAMAYSNISICYNDYKEDYDLNNMIKNDLTQKSYDIVKVYQKNSLFHAILIINLNTINKTSNNESLDEALSILTKYTSSSYYFSIIYYNIFWYTMRLEDNTKAIDYLANMKNNHNEITDLLLEIRNELEKLNQKKLSNENSNDK